MNQMAKKILKLDKITAGNSSKQLLMNVTDEYGNDLPGVYVFGQIGDISSQPVSSDSTMYNSDGFQRDSSIKSPFLNDSKDSVDLELDATPANIISILQCEDWTYSLCRQSTIPGSYALKTITPTDPKNYHFPKHELCTYKYEDTPSGSLTAQIPDIVINNFDNDFEDIYWVYGSKISGTLFCFGPTNTTGDTVYAIREGENDSLPFSYILEQNLSNQPHFAENYDEVNRIFVNAFKTKCMYDPYMESHYDRNTKTQSARRVYNKIGMTSNDPWLSYNFVNSDNNDKLQNYEFVEVMRGIYKLTSKNKHKSNLFSVRIKNSGLNRDIKDETERAKLQNMVNKEVRKIVTEITPIYTQLFQVFWEGA
jgi:hypothetical protein